MPKAKQQWVIVIGDPVHGIDLIGPFPSDGDAEDWANDHCGPAPWVVAPIIPRSRAIESHML